MSPMKPIQTHILKAFRILEVPKKSNLAGIAFQTAAGGRHRFVTTRSAMMQLAESLREHASKMPPESKGGDDPLSEPNKDPQDWFNA